MKRYLFLVVLGVLAPSRAPAADAEGANPLYEEMVGKGIAIPSGPTYKFPAPLIAPGSAPSNVMELLNKAAGRVPIRYFLQNAKDAPFSLTISSVNNKDGERCAQEVDLKFIAYAKLEAVLESDFVKQLLGGKAKKGGDDKSIILKSDELKKRGIRLLEARNYTEQYSTMTMELLEKVHVEGVMRSVRTSSQHFVLSASRMDDRFQKDKEYPNIWQHINVLAKGAKLGPSHPYAGMSAYVLVTKLLEPEGALLIEMHYLLPEPPDWFGEHNLLRSKLPIVIRDNVRSFRRKLSR